MRYRHIGPHIVGGRNEIYARDDDTLPREEMAGIPLEPNPEHLMEIVKSVAIRQRLGWSIEEIQRGYRNEQTETS